MASMASMALAPTSLLSAVQPASSAMASPPTQILCTNQADEPQRRSPNLQLNLSIWLLAGLALVFLVLRLWSKFLRRRKLWWDDYLLVAAWVCLFVGCVLESADVRVGNGIELAELTHSQQVSSSLVSQTSGFFLILAAVWSKTSFAVTLLRISDGWVKNVVWFIIISINLAIGGSVAIQWFWCWPSVHIWDPEIPATCLSREFVNGYNIVVAGYSGAMDVLLAILPWRIVWSLTMNRKEKFGVGIAMSMGVFAGATSFLKIPALLSIDKPGITHVMNLMIFSTAESAITIMAASIPIMRTLLHINPGPTPDMSLPMLKTRENASMEMQHYATQPTN